MSPTNRPLALRLEQPMAPDEERRVRAGINASEADDAMALTAEEAEAHADRLEPDRRDPYSGMRALAQPLEKASRGPSLGWPRSRPDGQGEPRRRRSRFLATPWVWRNGAVVASSFWLVSILHPAETGNASRCVCVPCGTT
jgi:hypothetical protein